MGKQPTKPKGPKRPQGAAPDQPVIEQIMHALGETADHAEAQIRQIVQLLGQDRALAVLAQTEQVEASGGMMLPDGSRKRTKGGVFFRLVRDQVTPEQRAKIFPSWNKRKPAQPTAPEPSGPR